MATFEILVNSADLSLVDAVVTNITNTTITNTASEFVISKATEGIAMNAPGILSNTTDVITNATINMASNANSTGIFGGIFTGELTGTSLAIIGAGIAVGAAGIASAIGAGITGATGARAVAEDSKSFSTSLLFQALPQTQGIYGFLIAILILLGAGVVGVAKDITIPQGIGAIGAGLAVGIAAVSAIGQGIAASSAIGATTENKKMFGKSILFSVLPETQALYGFIISILILIGVGLFGGGSGELSIVTAWATLGAGLAVGVAGISAIGQGIAASGGIGAVLEKSKVFGKSILFAVLPETQALYGFIVAILILIGFGVLGVPNSSLTLTAGIIALSAGLAVGLAGVSAIGQGIAASGGINAITEDDKMFGKSILFSVLPETQALYGFLIAILLLVGGGIIGATKVGLTSALGIISIGASLAVGLAAVSAIGQGVSASAGISAVTQKKEMFGKSIIFSIIPETQALMGFLIAILLLIGSGIIGTVKLGLTLPMGLIAIGSGLAIGLAAISAVGQGYTVSSGIAAVTHEKKLFGKALLFSVLPQTQALYGFLIAILLMVGGGIIGAEKTGLSPSIGLIAIGAGLAVGIAAVSAIGQGVSAAAGITSVADKKEMFGKSIIFSIIPETQALMGFLIAILLMTGSGLMGAAKFGLSLPMGLVAIGAGLAVGLAAISAIGQGFVVSSGIGVVTQDKKLFGKSLLFSVLPQTQALYGFLIAILLLIGGGFVGPMKEGLTIVIGLVAVAVGLAVGFSAVSAVGQGIAASSGVGAIAQNKKLFGKSILFSVLPETQALYGFIISILIMIGVGLIGGIRGELSMVAGFACLGAGLAVGIAGVSAIGQGIAAAGGIGAVVEKGKVFGKSILFAVLPETQALYGFIVAVLILIGFGILGAPRTGLTLAAGLISIGAGLAVGLAGISAVGQGLAASGGIKSITEDDKMFGRSILFSVLPETQALYGFLIAILLLVGGGILTLIKTGLTIPIGLIAIGAGLAVGLGAISAIGQGIAASSGVGAVSEDKKMFGKSILFSVLPETQALYGTIIAVLLLTGVGLMGVIKSGVTYLQGIGGIGVGITMGLAAISAIGQGVVSASSIGATLRDVKSMGKSLVLSVIPETYAIFGLLISILILLGLNII